MSVGRLRKAIKRYDPSFIVWDNMVEAAKVYGVKLPRAFREFQKGGISVLVLQESGEPPHVATAVVGDLNSGFRARVRPCETAELDSLTAERDTVMASLDKKRQRDNEAFQAFKEIAAEQGLEVGQNEVVDAENCPVCKAVADGEDFSGWLRAMGESSDWSNVTCFTDDRDLSDTFGIPFKEGEDQEEHELLSEYGIDMFHTIYIIQIGELSHGHNCLPRMPERPVIPDTDVKYPIGNGRYVSGPPRDQIDPEHCLVCKAIAEDGDIEAAMKSMAEDEETFTFGNPDLL